MKYLIDYSIGGSPLVDFVYNQIEEYLNQEDNLKSIYESIDSIENISIIQSIIDKVKENHTLPTDYLSRIYNFFYQPPLETILGILERKKISIIEDTNPSSSGASGFESNIELDKLSKKRELTNLLKKSGINRLAKLFGNKLKPEDIKEPIIIFCKGWIEFFSNKQKRREQVRNGNIEGFSTAVLPPNWYEDYDKILENIE